uniref:HECT domain-containing protein n=1 Tax=Amphimedon queenslandica TaxID=400682 RepID=A0A1X7SYT3_AMPQE
MAAGGGNDEEEMDKILVELGFEDEEVRENFRREKILPVRVHLLSVIQLKELGIPTIGEQAVLKEACKTHVIRNSVVDEVKRIMKPLPSSPGSSNPCFTSKRKKKPSQSFIKFKKGDSFQKKLVVFRFMGNDVTLFSKRDDYILATGLLGEISLESPEYRIREEIVSILYSAGPKFYCIDRNDFEFIDVSGKKATVPLFKEGQELTGKVIKELAGRGPVYIRLTKPLSKASEDQRIVLSSSSSDSDFELPPVSFLSRPNDTQQLQRVSTSSHTQGLESESNSSTQDSTLPTITTSTLSGTETRVSSHTISASTGTSSRYQGSTQVTSSRYQYSTQPGTSSRYQGSTQPGTSSHYQDSTQPGTSSRYQDSTQPRTSSRYQDSTQPGTSSHYQDSTQPGTSSRYQDSTQPGTSSRYQDSTQPGTSSRYQDSTQPGTSSRYQDSTHPGTSSRYQDSTHPGTSSRYQDSTQGTSSGFCTEEILSISPLETMHSSYESVTDFEMLKIMYPDVSTSAIDVIYKLCLYNRKDSEKILSNVTLNELLLKVCQNALTAGDFCKISLSANFTPQEICESIFAFYKGPFKRESSLHIRVTGSSTIDLGGVRRQMFSVFFGEVASGGFDLFEGPRLRLQPRIKPANIASGLLKVFGTAVAHSLIMDRVGFPYLSPAIYYYAVGCEEKAMSFVMDNDLSGQFQYAINELKSSPADVIVKDSDDMKYVEAALNDAGSDIDVDEVKNKDAIIQTLMIHDALHRRKAFIDCFCDGLEVYGLFTLMKGFPQLFEQVFISSDMSCDDVIGCINLPTQFISDLSDDECSVVFELHDYLRQLSLEG